MTTQNLYNDLHRRSSGWDEGFLTEALIHLIKYMQEYEADAACTILNRLTANLLRTVNAKMSEVVISTQYATEFGYPDICLRHPDFLVLIEVKVDADFHDGQLEAYREVLSSSGLPNVRLNTLTRYGQAGDRSEVDLAVRWNQVADWLDLRDLTNQIARYLHYLAYTPAQPFGYRVLHAALQWVPLGDHDMSASHFKILTWHSINVNANTYNGNDQIAVAADLRTLHEAGARIWPLAEALMALDAGTLPENVVVLTADDGAMLDFLPFEHPSCGPQPGLYRILREFVDEVGPATGTWQ